MNKTYCDKCGAEIKNSIYGFKLHPARLQFKDWFNVSQAFQLSSMELCNKCMKDLRGFLKGEEIK